MTWSVWLSACCAGIPGVAPPPPPPPPPPAPEPVVVPAPAPEEVLLVLAEADTAADAHAALAAARPVLEALTREQLLTLRPGFPKVLASDGVDGLAPGAHLAVLGACPKDAFAVDQALAAFPRARAVPATWADDGAACPELGPLETDWDRFATSKSLGPLTVALFCQSIEEGESSQYVWTALAIAEDEVGHPVAIEVVGGQASPELIGDSSAVGVVERSTHDPCPFVVPRDWTPPAPEVAPKMTHTVTSTTFRVDDAGSLRIEETDETYEQDCYAPAILPPGAP